MGEPHTTAPNSGSPSLEADRRGFLGGATVIAMCGGLAAGYGTFLAFAGRFLFPDASKTNWLFVDRAQAISPGGSVAFTTPNGNAVVVKRSADAPAAAEPLSEDFVALSSTCPHLGCRVHWEPQNDRFFCPCHNGAFDSQGRPTEGPPLAANQHLPRYPLRIEDGLLFIGISGESVTAGNTMEAESPGLNAPEARPRLENEA
jgi:Rieske Fe-S protein